MPIRFGYAGYGKKNLQPGVWVQIDVNQGGRSGEEKDLSEEENLHSEIRISIQKE